MKTLQALLLGLSLLAIAGLSACHTVQGLGEDTAEAGHAIEHAAGH
jgi:predicted small secreted protein